MCKSKSACITTHYITTYCITTRHLGNSSIDHIQDLGGQKGIILQAAFASSGCNVPHFLQHFKPTLCIQVMSFALERLFKCFRRGPCPFQVTHYSFEVLTVISFGMILGRPCFEPFSHLLNLIGNIFFSQYFWRYIGQCNWLGLFVVFGIFRRLNKHKVTWLMKKK